MEDDYSEYGVVQGLLHKRRKKSKVCGELLQGMNAQGEKIPTCKHCKVILCANPRSSTSHLKCHCIDVQHDQVGINVVKGIVMMVGNLSLT